VLLPDVALGGEQGAALLGQGHHDDAAVLRGAAALHDPRGLEVVEHLRHAGRRQLGGQGELARGHLVLLAQHEERPDLREAQAVPALLVATPQAALGGEHLAQRPRDGVDGGLALGRGWGSEGTALTLPHLRARRRPPRAPRAARGGRSRGRGAPRASGRRPARAPRG